MMIDTKAQEVQPPMVSVPPPEYSIVQPSQPAPRAQLQPPTQPQWQPPAQPQTSLAAVAQLGEQYRANMQNAPRVIML
ncbi:hypothetical protein C0995_008022 [Termitomyces sp. Mi166|nr:hypothetical protein C0995_008022 [Termitomyces sp. Mi166\